ncbi:MAG: AbrB/MazE/SpoVT family DNA-binding domain-containing protein [Desulfatiglandaceae bacterium]|jgi:antitoxin MazE
MDKQLISKVKTIKIVPIGNSKGIRLPKTLLQKYGFSENVIIEEKSDGLLLKRSTDRKLSWEEGFKEMDREKENWDSFDSTLMDGLDEENFDL